MRNDGSIERDEAIVTNNQLARALKRIKVLEAENAQLRARLGLTVPAAPAARRFVGTCAADLQPVEARS